MKSQLHDYEKESQKGIPQCLVTAVDDMTGCETHPYIYAIGEHLAGAKKDYLTHRLHLADYPEQKRLERVGAWAVALLCMAFFPETDDAQKELEEKAADGLYACLPYVDWEEETGANRKKRTRKVRYGFIPTPAGVWITDVAYRSLDILKDGRPVP
ncbi:hypothetical protein [Megasphaera sp.]|uniref:hypothetical protein n=1 Tax=Megasphaera sp. TaxID=2023260 RepID=UPI00307F109A